MAEGGIDLDTFHSSEIEDTGTDETDLSHFTITRELLQSTVDDYYNALGEDKNYVTPMGKDYTKFKIDSRGTLRLRAYPHVDLMNKTTRRPLALSTIAGRHGTDIIRQELGLVDYKRSTRLPPRATTALQTASRELGATAAVMDSTDDTDKIMGEMNRSIDSLDDIIATMDDSPLPRTELPPLLQNSIRELRGLDKAMQTMRGSLINNIAKLKELDKHIAIEKRKLMETRDPQDIARINDRIRDLQDERSARLEAASTNKKALRSQVSRIRETIDQILNHDTTLAERIRTLFREQGITITSILTALGLLISTLTLAFTGGSTPISPPPPPPSDGIKEWIKKHLKSLGQALAKLAGKAASVLPGILGSIVSWLLNLLSKTASWFSQNLWALVVTMAGLLYVAAKDWLSRKPDHE